MFFVFRIEHLRDIVLIINFVLEHPYCAIPYCVRPNITTIFRFLYDYNDIDYFRIPFDTKTIYGFWIELFLEIPPTLVYLLIFLAILTFFIGFSTYMTTFIEDFELTKNKYNEIARFSKNKSERDQKIKQYFSEGIKFHANIIE